MALPLVCLLLIVVSHSALADRAPHGPISIDGDGAFTAGNGVVSGDGSAGDPFLIEGYAIVNPPKHGIRIANTTSYFVIRNVTVTGPVSSFTDGISLENVTDGRVFDVTIGGFGDGVHAESAKGLLIENGEVNGSHIGISIIRCESTVVREVVTRVCDAGIVSSFATGTRLEGCLVQGCWNGIDIGGHEDERETGAVVEGCHVNGSDIGIELVYTTGCEIRDCTVLASGWFDILMMYAEGSVLGGTQMGTRGLSVEGDYLSLRIEETNTVGGRPLRYIKHGSGLAIGPDTGQLYLVGCRDVAVGGPSFDGVVKPIVMYESTGCTVQDVDITHAYYGIWIEGGGPHRILGVNVTEPLFPEVTSSAVFVQYGNVSLEECTLSGYVYGIEMSGPGQVDVSGTAIDGGVIGIEASMYPYPEGVHVGGNLTMERCNVGDLTFGLMIDFWNLTLRNSTFAGCSQDAVRTNYADHVLIEGCNFTRCGMIQVGGAFRPWNVVIARNRIEDPKDIGIYLSTTYEDKGSARIEDNVLIGCTKGIVVRCGDSTSVSGNIISCDGPEGQIGVELVDAVRTNMTDCDISGYATGLLIGNSFWANVTRCSVKDCGIGVEVRYGSGFTVAECTIEECRLYGISMVSQGGLVHHNALRSNNMNASSDIYNGPQAFDGNWEHNSWDDGIEGNYWSDYRIRYPDAKVVGRVWDTPYEINATVGAADRFPLVYMRDLVPPVADGGGDRTVGEDATVVLDGTGSSDDVGIVDYTWSFIRDGATVVLAGPVAEVVFDELGDVMVTLTVRDGWGNEASDTAHLRVVDLTPPFAEAGPDVLVDAGAAFAIDGSGSRDKHGIATYAWTIDPDGLRLASSDAQATFTIGSVGDYIATLNVTDPSRNWATDSLVIRVRDMSPPVARAGQDASVDMRVQVVLDGSGSTDNVGIVSYEWSFVSSTGQVTLEGPVTTYVFDRPGRYIVTLNVTDAAGNWAIGTKAVTVRDTEPPVAVAGPDRTVIEGQVVTLDGTASHDNVGLASFKWRIYTKGALYLELTGAMVRIDRFTDEPFTYKMPQGIYRVKLQVTDVEGNVGICEFNLTVVPLAIEWRLGPFLDDEGERVDGARVRVVLNGTSYNGTTDGWGWLNLLVSRFDRASPAVVVATKRGFDPYNHTVPLDDQGQPVDPLPAMVRARRMWTGADAWTALVLVVAVSAAIMLIVLAMRQRRKGGRPRRQARQGR